jgi:alpha-ketoglutarate-dependent taurine dioxygenase
MAIQTNKITSDLVNTVQIDDIDLNNDNECNELGKIVSQNTVVVINSACSEKRLFDIQTSWGSPSRCIVHDAVVKRKLKGRHWRKLYLHLGYTTKLIDPEIRSAMCRVSFENKDGRPLGVFENNDTLDWHSDQPSVPDSQRVISLMSLHGTEGSTTSFLDTSLGYEDLSSDDKSMVNELTTVWKWDGGYITPGLIEGQVAMTRYFFCPIDGLQTPLINETASGIKGIKFPYNCWWKFDELNQKESDRFRNHLWEKINKSKYVYEHKWKDGQICFMDQSITLHARLTSVAKSSTRTLSRCVTYLNNIIEGSEQKNHVYYQGKKLDVDSFLSLIDNERHKEFLMASK